MKTYKNVGNEMLDNKWKSETLVKLTMVKT
jgi:hypothetical protein